jgi:hypothetical protein
VREPLVECFDRGFPKVTPSLKLISNPFDVVRGLAERVREIQSALRPGKRLVNVRKTRPHAGSIHHTVGNPKMRTWPYCSAAFWGIAHDERVWPVSVRPNFLK